MINKIILAFFILVYISLFSFLSIRKVYTLQSHYFDLGIMNQVVYNTSQEKFLEMTNQDFGKNISRLAVHFDPILAILSPFYKVHSGFETLLIIQSVVLGLGALAVYLIANKILKDKKIGLIMTVSYLLFFPVERANLFDFHPVTLATTFLLFMIYFSLVKKYWLMILFVFLALLTKEHTGLVIIFFGMYLFLFSKEKKWSLFLIISGLIFFVISVSYIIPYFRQETHFALKYFDDFGDSPKNVFIGLIKNPLLIAGYFTKNETWLYLGRLLLQYGIFIIFSPLQLLIALPEIMINILSSNNNMRSIYFHYNSLTVPFIILSAIYGIKKIQKSFSKKYMKLFWIIFFGCCLTSIYFFNPLPVSYLKEPYWWGFFDNKKITIIKNWHETLDKEQAVATTPILAPFFTGRKNYFNFLYDPSYLGMKQSDNDIIKRIGRYNLADYIVIDRQEIFDDKAGLLPAKFYEDLLNNKSYKKIFSEKGIEVYKKTNL